jgi:co-chaperonin GroES (HSP10)
VTEFKKSDKLADIGMREIAAAPGADAARTRPADFGIEIYNGDILVLRDPAPDTAGESGRIQLPDMAKRDPYVGTVVLVAKEGRGGGPPKFAAGDRVRFASLACGQPVELRGETYLRMSEMLVWARETGKQGGFHEEAVAADRGQG